MKSRAKIEIVVLRKNGYLQIVAVSHEGLSGSYYSKSGKTEYAIDEKASEQNRACIYRAVKRAK